MMALKKEAQERVNELYAQHGGVTPEIVIEDAKSKSSPLHDLFEWNVKEAAYKHWLQTARMIIHSVPIIKETETIRIPTPRYVRDPAAKGREQGYVSVFDLQKNQPKAIELLQLEFSRIESMIRRTQSIGAVLDLDDDFQMFLVSLDRLKTAAEKKAA